MLYHIRVGGRLPDEAALALPDVVVVEGTGHQVLSCQVVDAAALTGVVAYLHDLGLRVLDLQVVEDPDDERDGGTPLR